MSLHDMNLHQWGCLRISCRSSAAWARTLHSRPPKMGGTAWAPTTLAWKASRCTSISSAATRANALKSQDRMTRSLRPSAVVVDLQDGWRPKGANPASLNSRDEPLCEQMARTIFCVSPQMSNAHCHPMGWEFNGSRRHHSTAQRPPDSALRINHATQYSTPQAINDGENRDRMWVLAALLDAGGDESTRCLLLLVHWTCR